MEREPYVQQIGSVGGNQSPCSDYYYSPIRFILTFLGSHIIAHTKTSVCHRIQASKLLTIKFISNMMSQIEQESVKSMRWG